jgi:hypothetical protein
MATRSSRGVAAEIAEMLPDDVIAELYEDPAYPGYTFMELRLAQGAAGFNEPGFKVVYPEQETYPSDDAWASGTGY